MKGSHSVNIVSFWCVATTRHQQQFKMMGGSQQLVSRFATMTVWCSWHSKMNNHRVPLLLHHVGRRWFFCWRVAVDCIADNDNSSNFNCHKSIFKKRRTMLTQWCAGDKTSDECMKCLVVQSIGKGHSGVMVVHQVENVVRDLLELD